MHTEYLDTSFGKIAYQTFQGNSDVGFIFMNGLASDMTGNKSEHLKLFCKNEGISFTRFDYFGHGASDGDFLRGNISIWTQNALEILKNVTFGSQILIGSSMSGWIMFAVAQAFPEKIKGLVGIGSAPDFTEDFRKYLPPEAELELTKNGYFLFSQSGDRKLLISKTLLDDGLNNLILGKKLKVNCPVILMHGLADEIVSYEKSIELTQNLESPRVEVRLVKGADHSMSDSISLDILNETLRSLLHRSCSSNSGC